MEALGIDADFWRGRSVLITGHTGFKGAWLSFWLTRLGARVTGYALPPESAPNLYTLLDAKNDCISEIADVRDRASIERVLKNAGPSVVFHLAAQALVRRGYDAAVETFATNVMGTANLLDAVRNVSSVRGVVVVTTDKCYANIELVARPFRESDPLGGFDPYSASKAAAEIVTAAYRSSFLANAGVVVATARAGNVIGGGDWSRDRIVPDIIRAAQDGRAVELRHPGATKPWQHVLEPLAGYMLLAQRAAAGDTSIDGAWNFGPSDDGDIPVSRLVEMMQEELGAPLPWVPNRELQLLHEAQTLRLDAGKARSQLDWRPRLSMIEAVRLTAQWYRRVASGESPRDVSAEQLESYAS